MYKNIKYLFYDFDGVMTDNRVLVDENGIEAVFVNRSDGLAVSMLKIAGFSQMIVSTEKNPVVSMRAKKLAIPVLYGVENKGLAIRDYIITNNIDRHDALYIGNDINDLSAFNEVGVKACPSDAYAQVKDISDIVIDCKGGFGVIRELYNILTYMSAI